MQSAGRRAPEPLAPDDLDQPIRDGAAGAGARSRDARPPRDRHAAPGALLPPVPLRRLQRPAAARRPGPRREAVGAGAGRRRQRRAGIRAASAAGHRPALGPDRHRRGDLVRPALRRAAPRAGGRDRGERQGHLPWLAAAVHLARSSRRSGTNRSTPRGSCRSTGSSRASRSAACASCWPASSSARCRRWPIRCGRRERGDLPPLADALRAAHFPEEAADVAGRAGPPRLRRAAGAPADDGPGAPRPCRPAGGARHDRRRRAGAAAGGAPVRADRRPATRGGRDRRRPRLRPADAAAAAGRRGERQDGGRGGRAGGRGAGRLAGGADGAHRDPRAPAPPRPGAAPRGARRARRIPVRIAHRRPPRGASTTPSRRGRRRS